MAGGNTELDAVEEARAAARTGSPGSESGTGLEIDPLLGAAPGKPAPIGEAEGADIDPLITTPPSRVDVDDTDAAPRVEDPVDTTEGPLGAEDATHAPDTTVAVPASDTAMSPRRRWWQRIFEFDAGTEQAANGNGNGNGNGYDPGQNGHHPAGALVAPAPGEDPLLGPSGRNGDTATHDETLTAPVAAPVDRLTEPGTGGETRTDEAAPEPAATTATATTAPGVEGRTPPPVGDALLAEPETEPDSAIGDHRAWVLPPLVEPDVEPDFDDPTTGPPLEPARTGEIPRVPLLAAERARLIPEPSREPSWVTRRRTRRPRVRRVTRVVRRVDAWSVFKVALLFWVVAYLILLVAGVLLWSVAVSTGTIDNVESFLKDLLALDTFTLDGQKIFRASWLLGAFMAIAGTGLTVTVAVLYNLFSDLVGGVRITVLEEEVVQRPPSAPPS